MTEFVENRLKGAENHDWIRSGLALRRAIIKNELSMPDLEEVVEKLIGVWPLVVPYWIKTGRKENGGSLVVGSSVLDILSSGFCSRFIVVCCLEEKSDGFLYFDHIARMNFGVFFLTLEICN